MGTDHRWQAGLSRRSVLKIGAGLTAGLSLSALGIRDATAAGEQILRVVHPVFDMDWSPMRGGGAHQRWTSLWWASPMYFNAKGAIHPYVFTSWQPADGGKSWVFTLAPNAVFSDGSPITAEDVKGSFELAAMPATRNQRVAQVLSGVEGYAAVSGGAGKALTGVTVKDPKTVVVTLTQPDPIFFMRLANHIVPIVKASEARGGDGSENAEWWAPKGKGASSGPFRLTAIDIDKGLLTFEPNPNFFGPKPKLTRVEIRTVEDAVTATALIRKGEFNAHTELVTSTLVKDLGADFAGGPQIPTSQHFWFHIKRKPMEDPKVRQALVMAIDREGLFKASYPDGPHKKADQILNAVPGVDEALKPYPFDPDAAKKLLAESSYKGPERLPKLRMVGISSPAIQAAAQFIAEQWRQNLGITAVEMKPQQDSYTGPDQASVQIFRDDVGTRVPDAVSYLMGSIHSSSSNAKNKMGGYKNAEVDKHLDAAALKAVDDPERQSLAQQAQRVFMADYAFIPWYSQTMSRWAATSVAGMDKNLDWQVPEPWSISIG
jgi:peptide/nickel transport system substrate-binding protein